MFRVSENKLTYDADYLAAMLLGLFSNTLNVKDFAQHIDEFIRPCQTKSGPMHHGMRLARQVGIPSEDQAMTVRHSASAAERLCL